MWWDNEDEMEGNGWMKKIKTLYKMRFLGGRAVVLEPPEVTPGMEWVMDGDGEATEKVDGSACAIIAGMLYRRYDANVKKGRLPPPSGVACQSKPDPITGHWPFWVPVTESAEDKWYREAYYNTPWCRADGTYEAVGPHFRSNPYGLDEDFIERHGRIKLRDCPRDFYGIREYLRTHEIEGIVFWKDGEPKCKIRRKDFGFEWPVRWDE